MKVKVDLYSAFMVGSHLRRSGMDHTVLPAYYTISVSTSPDGATSCRHLIAAYYSFIHPERTKGCVSLVG